ncbi:hypothetical protein EP7_005101 [Isosphaeraceae bacterium EP7]
MPWKETLFERKLKRPVDGPLRKDVEDVYQRRRGEIPISTDLSWHPEKPEFTIRSKLLSFIVRFTQDQRMVVEAELSLAAKLMATDANRRQAVAFIESIADDLKI